MALCECESSSSPLPPNSPPPLPPSSCTTVLLLEGEHAAIDEATARLGKMADLLVVGEQTWDVDSVSKIECDACASAIATMTVRAAPFFAAARTGAKTIVYHRSFYASFYNCVDSLANPAARLLRAVYFSLIQAAPRSVVLHAVVVGQLPELPFERWESLATVTRVPEPTADAVVSAVLAVLNRQVGDNVL